MQKERLTSLADSIFAIVMTLLVLTLNIPEIRGVIDNTTLWSAIKTMNISFLSYVFSFSLLFVYWRAHHFIVSIYAKNIDFNLTTINAVFFLLIALIPFSTHLMGVYSDTQVAVSLFATHIILVGLVLYGMKRYVISAHDIENIPLTVRDRRHGNVRILLPVFFALLAIPFSFINTTIPFLLFALAVIFNLIPHSTNIVIGFIDLFRPKQKGNSID